MPISIRLVLLRTCLLENAHRSNKRHQSLFCSVIHGEEKNKLRSPPAQFRDRAACDLGSVCGTLKGDSRPHCSVVALRWFPPGGDFQKPGDPTPAYVWSWPFLWDTQGTSHHTCSSTHTHTHTREDLGPGTGRGSEGGRTQEGLPLLSLQMTLKGPAPHSVWKRSSCACPYPDDR